jgi:hypothetical protein
MPHTSRWAEVGTISNIIVGEEKLISFLIDWYIAMEYVRLCI